MRMIPKTYAELRPQLAIEPDPFAIRDNIFSCTAHLHQMDDSYGTVGTAGAYNAGPGRWERHLAGLQSLPNGTVGYLAKQVQRLGSARSAASILLPRRALIPHSSCHFSSHWRAHMRCRDRRPIYSASLRSSIANTTILLEFGGMSVRSSNAELPIINDQQIDA